MTNQTVDCKGMNCPMPIVTITKAIRKLESGDTLDVEATDRAFKPDLEAWARKTGNEILSFLEGEVLKAQIKKK